jgi:hypothetical protein
VPETTQPVECSALLQEGYSEFASFLNAAGMENIGGTVLAPSNAAINAMPNRAEILADRGLAQQFVNGHLLSALLTAEELAATPNQTTTGGQQLTIAGATITGPDGLVGTIDAADQECAGGIVQGIDGVLFVPEVSPPTEPPTGS